MIATHERGKKVCRRDRDQKLNGRWCSIQHKHSCGLSRLLRGEPGCSQTLHGWMSRMSSLWSEVSLKSWAVCVTWSADIVQVNKPCVLVRCVMNQHRAMMLIEVMTGDERSLSIDVRYLHVLDHEVAHSCGEPIRLKQPNQVVSRLCLSHRTTMRCRS